MRKKVFALILLVSLVFASGCWDMREINELGLVMAVGIDKSATNPDEYLVTVQVANPQMNASTSENKGSQETIWIASGEGKTIFAAIRNIARFSSQRIMWAHNNVIIVGESLARDDITPVVDFFSHNHELRMKTWIAVARGNASDYLQANAGMGNIPGQSLGDVFRYQQLTGFGLHSNLLKVYADVTSETTNPLIASLSLNEALTKPGLSKQQDNTKEQIEMAGMAVFDNKRMVGYLSNEETLGISWLLSQNPDTVISVTHPNNSAKSVAIEITGVKVKIDSELNQDFPEFNIKISGAGQIAEEDTTSELSIDEFKDQLEMLSDQLIIQQVQMGINKVQKDYQSDVLGFGQIVHTQHKEEWNATLKDRWVEIYPEAEVRVEAKIEIKSSTLNQIPLQEHKESANTYD